MSDAVSYEDYLAAHGSFTYTNVGTSMLPLLREGRDLFTVVPKGETRCRVGDVVLYRRPPSSYVLHRVVALTDSGYLTLGDNCVARERVAEGDVIAVMTGFVRGGRTHDVGEKGYRAYTHLVLLAEHPRVVARRLVVAVRQRARRLAHGR